MFSSNAIETSLTEALLANLSNEASTTSRILASSLDSFFHISITLFLKSCLLLRWTSLEAMACKQHQCIIMTVKG